MKLSKQVLVALVVLFVSTSVHAACANREKDDSSDLFGDIKCGLSTAGDKIKDGASSVGSSIKEGTTKALVVISKAAVKTGNVLLDGLHVAVEKSKSGYEIVKDAITGHKTSEYKDGVGVIDVRAVNVSDIR